ncbi:MAG: tRNA pseudouridine(38-40) synthase TruA, partial [Gemmatimonadales bacterium]
EIDTPYPIPYTLYPLRTFPHMGTRSCYAVLEYDGTHFFGWQRQPAERTVQGEVETALAKLTQTKSSVIAAGRTDTGVHALGQTISFSVPDRWDPEDLSRAMNAVLPSDIRVLRAGASPPAFNARKDAAGREYGYVIGLDSGARSPFRVGYEWALCRALDMEAVAAATGAIAGDHDFRAFAAVGQQKPHYRCRVGRVEWSERPGDKGVIFHIVADRFLHHMVRFLVGTLVEIGLGKRPVEDLERLLNLDHNSETSAPAPPEGLYLVRVDYPQFEPAETK